MMSVFRVLDNERAVALPSLPRGALPPLRCVDDAYETVTSMYTVSPLGA